MTKKFISVINKANTGKTTSLTKLWKDCGGCELDFNTKDGKAVCKIDGKFVFVQTASPQERGKGDLQTILKILEEDIEYFERIAKMFGISDIIIIMAFNSSPRNPAKVNDAIALVRQKGYDYDSIQKESSRDGSKDDILPEVRKKI